MPLIEWREEFRIGIPAVDYEHQELIALLNELYAGLGEGPGTGGDEALDQTSLDRASVGAFLGEVYARISAHFALEEREMRARGYDQAAAHKADHEDLLDAIRDIMDDVDDKQVELSPEALGPETLGHRLEAWFSEHFRTHDARLHKSLHSGSLDLGEI